MPLLIGEVRKISHCSYFCVTLLIYPRIPQKMFGVNVSVISIEEIQSQGSLTMHNFPGFLFKNSNFKVKKKEEKKKGPGLETPLVSEITLFMNYTEKREGVCCVLPIFHSTFYCYFKMVSNINLWKR